MHVNDQLIHTTVRIETSTETSHGSGTGFFFRFCQSGDQSIECIVTNKHVVKDCDGGAIHFTLRNPDGSPGFGNKKRLEIKDFEKSFIPHPNENIDLCVMPLAPILNYLHDETLTPFYLTLDPSIIAPRAVIDDLTSIEDILAIGYPDGIWDEVNNTPIVRRGITATPYYLDFESKPEFLIDLPVFNGQSGSPVFLYNVGGWATKSGGFVIGGARIHLLGIISHVFIHTASGVLEVSPMQKSPRPLVEVPNNVGIAIKSRMLLDFIPILERLAGWKSR